MRTDKRAVGVKPQSHLATCQACGGQTVVSTDTKKWACACGRVHVVGVVEKVGTK